MNHAQYYFATAGQLELMELSGRHRFLCTMPLYYAGSRANYLMYLIRGDCVVLYPSLVSASEYIELVDSLGITIATVVPRFIRELLSAAGDEPILSQLSLFATVGAPLHAEEKLLALRKLTPNFIDHYGASETLTISMLMPKDLPERPASVGRPHSLIRVETVDDQEQPTGPGEAGRLRARGPGMARPLPGAAEASFQDGWFYPGEIAQIDECGFLFIEGRTSEVIFRGGAKIHPAEVEAVLLEHPDVLDAAVVGRAIEGKDARVIAFIIPRGDVAVGRLIAHCRSRLSPHKVPQDFHFCAEFPRNASGKTDKLALARSPA
jgi:acyl-coenzyme A synthetase/AMP-(fatty) acid ligase